MSAELQLLGALLIKPESIEDLILRPSDFGDEALGELFGTLKALTARGEACDESVLRRHHPNHAEKIQEAELSISGVPIAGLQAEILENSKRRRLRKIAGLAQSIGEGGAAKAVSGIEVVLDEIRGLNASGYSKLSKQLPGFLDELQAGFHRKGTLLGLTTGIETLDGLTSGLIPGEMIVLGARPSVGKTALVLNMILAQAHGGSPVGLFSLEMGFNSLMHRMVSIRTGIDSSRIRKGFITVSQKVEVMEALRTLGDLPILVCDSPRMEIDSILSDARRMVRKDGARAIFIDYLGLIRHENPRLERFLQVADISARLKSLARELNVPVVVLSQLTRDTQGKAPTLANLRDSGAVEQDADVVILLSRQEEEETYRLISVDVAKNRNGPIGKIQLQFWPALTKFTPWEAKLESAS